MYYGTLDPQPRSSFRGALDRLCTFECWQSTRGSPGAAGVWDMAYHCLTMTIDIMGKLICTMVCGLTIWDMAAYLPMVCGHGFWRLVDHEFF